MYRLLVAPSRIFVSVALSLCLIVGACRSDNASKPKPLESLPTTFASPTSAAPEPSSKSSTIPPASTGAIVITLKDSNGAGPEGMPVQVEGTLAKRLISDSNGQVRLEGPPGNYRFKVVVGCSERLQVLSGGSGSGAIVAGMTATGQLNVDWQHRIAPSPPVFATENGPWRIGQMVVLKFGVIDRCNEEDRAPGAVYPTYIFKTGPTTKLIGDPTLKADGDGFGSVGITCASEGPPQVTVVDSKNRRDALDLVASASSGGSPYMCTN